MCNSVQSTSGSICKERLKTSNSKQYLLSSFSLSIVTHIQYSAYPAGQKGNTLESTVLPRGFSLGFLKTFPPGDYELCWQTAGACMVINARHGAEGLQLALFGWLLMCVRKLVFGFSVWEWSLKVQSGSLTMDNTTKELITFWTRTDTDLPNYSLLEARLLVSGPCRSVSHHDWPFFGILTQEAIIAEVTSHWTQCRSVLSLSCLGRSRKLSFSGGCK